MKRFSIFCAALFAAATSFAAVAYELNGGVQSAYLVPQDMYADLNADYNAATGDSKTWAPLAECTATNHGLPTAVATIDLTFFTDKGAAKWGWLATYVDFVTADQGVDLASASSAAMRYNLQSFFKDWQYVGWPKSADYTTCGVSAVAAYQSYWKNAFANPTNPTSEWTLNAPYKEGETFLGWYWNADFSGAKVTTINAESNGTLYAKFGEYIPNVAEVRALENAKETKVGAVVNFIDGNNLYIQDATGGILVVTAAAPTCKVGDNIVAKGVTGTVAGAPALENAVVESSEASKTILPTSFETLAPLVEDSLAHKYFATNVTIAGVTIVSYDTNGYPTVEDAVGTKALCHKMLINQSTFPVGKKVTITAIAGWNNGFQFVGDVAGIVLPLAGVKETYTYPARSNGRYSLENNWVISNKQDNFAANKPGSTQMVRGMAVKDGVMYFVSRESASLVRVDAKTGNMMEPLKLTGDHLFQKSSVDEKTGETVWSDATTLPFNDIKFDQAGNCLIGACLTGSTLCQTFFIYLVNLETGACTELINDVLWDNPGLDNVKFRFDAFGVAGDVTKNGVVMAADANDTWNAYRWLIKDGVAGEGEQVAAIVDPATTNSQYANEAGWGGAPQIFPQDEEGTLFYVDGFKTLPILFYGTPSEGAMIIDDFINVPSGSKVKNNDNEELSMNVGHNGLVEFQVGEEYFLLMAATNTAVTPPSSFALYKFANADRAFEGMTPLWYFPHNGLGSATNQCRTAVPSVEVLDEKTAVLYIYTPENGYGAYTLTIDPTIADNTAVEDVETIEVGAEKVIENGQIFILKNGIKYNALGAQVK